MHRLPNEKCELCHKQIYIHNVILVCSNDNKTYHAKCLKIDNDTALELQQSPDWCCPLCLKDFFPCFETDYSKDIENKCYSCSKIISPTRHRITHCTFCDNTCHYSCIIKPILACKLCDERINGISDDSETTDLNEIYSELTFNPFRDCDDDKDDKNDFFDDDIDDHNETQGTASNILDKCKYPNILCA